MGDDASGAASDAAADKTDAAKTAPEKP